MAKELKSGTRVLFADDERLDIPDTRALSDLVYDSLNEHAAAVFTMRKHATLGRVPPSGTLSALKFDVTDLENVVISTWDGSNAIFVHNFTNSDGYDETQVLVYDPSLSGQQTTIDLSGVVATNVPVIWAKRVDTNDAYAGRRKWGSGAETSFSLDTRESYRIVFDVTSSSSPPTGDIGWFAISQVHTGSSVSLFDMIHPLDEGRLPSERPSSENIPRNFGYYITTVTANVAPEFTFLGVAECLEVLRISAQGIASFATNIGDSLSGVDAQVDINTAAIEANANIAAADAAAALSAANSVSSQLINTRRLAPVGWCTVQPDGAGDWTIPYQYVKSGYAAITVTSAGTPWKCTVDWGELSHPPRMFQAVLVDNTAATNNYAMMAGIQTFAGPGISELIIRMTTLSKLDSTKDYDDTGSISPTNPTDNVYIQITFYDETA